MILFLGCRNDSVLVLPGNVGFFAGDESRAEGDTLGAEAEGGNDAGAVGDDMAAGLEALSDDDIDSDRGRRFGFVDRPHLKEDLDALPPVDSRPSIT